MMKSFASTIPGGAASVTSLGYEGSSLTPSTSYVYAVLRPRLVAIPCCICQSEFGPSKHTFPIFVAFPPIPLLIQID